MDQEYDGLVGGVRMDKMGGVGGFYVRKQHIYDPFGSNVKWEVMTCS